MSELLIKNKNGYNLGFTPITKIGEEKNNTDINFGILKLNAGETYDASSHLESAYLLMSGEVDFKFNDETHRAKRNSIFDEEPMALHLPTNQAAMIMAKTDCELAVSQVENDQHFEPLFFDKNNLLESEHRGQGLLNDTAYRIVRTIFDVRNRPDAKLVLGEVITFPGRWSSYPPHHHPQPEIYHYRFTEPDGFGFGQTGDNKGGRDVVTIENNDTLKILYDLPHAQTAAPGYGMYYIWVIKHLDGNPYTIPVFEETHA